MKATVFTGFGALGVFDSPQLTDIAKQNASTQSSLNSVSLFIARVSCKELACLKRSFYESSTKLPTWTRLQSSSVFLVESAFRTTGIVLHEYMLRL